MTSAGGWIWAWNRVLPSQVPVVGEALSAVLPLALVVGLSPLPALPMIVLLAGASSRAFAFLAVWFATLAVMLVAAATLSNATEEVSDEVAVHSIAWFQLALGIVLVGLGIGKWGKRPRAGETPEPPKWLARVGDMRAGASARLGILMAGANPKNLAMTIAAGIELGVLPLATGQAALAGLGYVLVASIAAGTPLIAFLLLGGRAGEVLAGWKTWLVANNTKVMAILLMVLGVLMALKSIPAVK